MNEEGSECNEVSVCEYVLLSVNEEGGEAIFFSSTSPSPLLLLFMFLFSPSQTYQLKHYSGRTCNKF